MKSRYALEMDTKSCGRGQLNPHARATRPTLKVPLRERKWKRIPHAHQIYKQVGGDHSCMKCIAELQNGMITTL